MVLFTPQVTHVTRHTQQLVFVIVTPPACPSLLWQSVTLCDTRVRVGVTCGATTLTTQQHAQLVSADFKCELITCLILRGSDLKLHSGHIEIRQ